MYEMLVEYKFLSFDITLGLVVTILKLKSYSRVTSSLSCNITSILAKSPRDCRTFSQFSSRIFAGEFSGTTLTNCLPSLPWNIFKNYYDLYGTLKFVFFEKATKFDKIFILLLTNKFVFLCFPPNFEFSASSQWKTIIHFHYPKNEIFSPAVFNILKEPFIVQKETLHQQKGLDLSYLDLEGQGRGIVRRAPHPNFIKSKFRFFQ